MTSEEPAVAAGEQVAEAEEEPFIPEEQAVAEAVEQEEEQVVEAEEEPLIPEWKLLLIGHKGVGQQEFISRFGVASETPGRPQVVLQTYRGKVKFNVWDSNVEADQFEMSGTLQDEFYQGARCAIIFFDVTSKATFKDVHQWHTALTRACRNIPVVLCASNSNRTLEERIQARNNFHRNKFLNYFEFTLEECGNSRFLDIFLWFVRKLSGDVELHFVLSPFEVFLKLVEAICTREKSPDSGVSAAELRVLRILADETHGQYRQVASVLAQHYYQNPFVGLDQAIQML